MNEPNKQVGFRATEAMIRHLDERAKAIGAMTNRSAVLRRLVEEDMRRTERTAAARARKAGGA